MSTNKTWAREAGFVLLALLVWLTVKASLGSGDAQTTLDTVLIPFLTFVGYAFGLKKAEMFSKT